LRKQLVAALQKCADELAASAAKPMFLETEFQALIKRISAPAAFPDEEYEFNEEQ